MAGAEDGKKTTVMQGGADADKRRQDSVQQWVNSLGDPDHHGCVVAAGGDVAMETTHGDEVVGAASAKLEEDDLHLGAEAKMLLGDDPVAAQTHALVAEALGFMSKKPRHVTLREQFRHMNADSFDSNASGKTLSSIDKLLHDRERNPEEVLASLGFGSADEDNDITARLPGRFIHKPSIAAGITPEAIAQWNPDMRDYVQSNQAYLQQNQSGTSPGQYHQFSCLQDVVRYLLDSNVPYRFLNSCKNIFKDLPLEPIKEQVGQKEAQISANQKPEKMDLEEGCEETCPQIVTDANMNDVSNQAMASVLATTKNNLQGNENNIEDENIVDKENKTPEKIERPGSLNLQPFDDEEGIRSLSSDSTVSPTVRYYYYNAILSPGESLV